MEIDDKFVFGPTPPINTNLIFALPAADSNLGPLSRLPGTWTGKGFNVIWRPFNQPGQDRFLELNLTNETLQFEEINGPIPNRGLLQADISMFGVTYLQQIQDANSNEGLHIEPGIWATVPVTINPQEPPTVVRMASIPHGTTVMAQGVVLPVFPGAPPIHDTDILPFPIGKPSKKITTFPEPNLAAPTPFRSSPAAIAGVTQLMVNNPNSLLQAAIAGQNITETVTLVVSSDSAAPVLGGGVANTAFLQGAPSAGPNAQAAVVSAIFWIETVTDPQNGSQFLQLQYTQTVLLNFAGLSWPHITVATLRKLRNSSEPMIAAGDSGDAVRWLQRALRRTGNLTINIDGMFGQDVSQAVREFQQGVNLPPDGIVGPKTWHALPEGGPMPTLHLGASGDVVKSLQAVLTNGAAGQWNVQPDAIDGNFGPSTQASVKAFQGWAQVVADGVVGDATWSASLHAAGATLENKVGLNFVQS